tara:strand:+ start:182 stop:730 length:549 start_codon:yes stop_codon:yes gene_type:complete
MTLRISKPSFNIREKINEMDGEVSREKMPSGSIIQVVQGKLTSQTESSAGQNVNVDIGLSASMSPHYKDSKVLVELDSLPIRMRSGGTSVHFLLQRKIGYNGTWRTHVATAEYSGSMSDNTYNFEYYPGLNYMDSPGTTDEVYYRIIGNKNSGSGNVAYNHNASGGRGAYNYVTLTLMEIKS